MITKTDNYIKSSLILEITTHRAHKYWEYKGYKNKENSLFNQNIRFNSVTMKKLGYNKQKSHYIGK